MAVADNSTEDKCVAKLNDLLRRARGTKPSTTIEPPLQVSSLITDNDSLLVPLKPFTTSRDEKAGKEVRNLTVESAAKRIFYAQLGSTRIEDPSFVEVWNLLDILQYYCDRELCAQQLVLVLVEELLDSLSLTQCRIVLTFLESRRDTLIAIKGILNKDLVVLRLCNELLRRQSRAEDPVFCGRVYIFLFQSFPLGDRSSVNLRGHFHVENVTTFEEFLTTSTPVDDQMEIDSKDGVNEELQAVDSEAKPTVSEPTETEVKPTTMNIDTLYPVFWSLQHCFSDPPQLFEEKTFKQFREGLEATLAKFKEVPKVIQAMDSSRTTSAQELLDEDQDTYASASNPKYLTSRDLFKLELSDLAFQRHILVQALIIVEFLLTLTEKSKSKAYYESAQKAMQYDFTLGEEDTEWALGIKNSIANYLQDGPDGKFFYRMVDTVLSRDKNWVRWKMSSCKPFTRPRVPATKYVESKTGAQKAVSNKRVLGPTKATSTLHFLSKTGSTKGLSKLRHNQKFTKPGPQTFAEQLRLVDLDIDMAQTEEETRQLQENKTSQTWRGLRLAAVDQLSSFDSIEHGKGLEKLPLTTVSFEAADDNAPTAPEDRDLIPQEEHRSVEEQRESQMTDTGIE